MRLVFFGTPPLAACVLERVAADHSVALVVTQPDRVRSRGKAKIPSAVKECAHALGVPVVEPVDLADEETLAALAAVRADCFCVAAFGRILPSAVLAMPRFGCVNVHASLLPRWRGAAPIERAILAGDERTGVCIMRMEEGLDTGPVCARREIVLADKDASQVAAELARIGGDELSRALRSIEAGTAHWVEQEGEPVYARKIEKGELNIGPDLDAATCVRRVRAASGNHRCRARIAGRDVVVERLAPAKAIAPKGLDGRLGRAGAAFVGKRLYGATTTEPVEFMQVRPSGRASMTGAAFAAGIQGIKDSIVEWGFGS